MSINENDSRVRRTKKLIRQGLITLAKNKSISKITVKELTDCVEINRGTFYLHYKDVYDLVENIEEELYSEFDEKISSVSSEELLKNPLDICESFCAHFYEHMELYGVLLGQYGDAQFSYKLGELLNDKVYELFKKIFPSMNKTKFDLAYNYGKFGYVGLLSAWFNDHSEWTPRQIAEMWLHLTTLGLWGILGDEGKEVLLNAKNSN